MAKADNSRQLTPEQERAVLLLTEGQSDRAVAEQVDVSRQTVTEWCQPEMKITI